MTTPAFQRVSDTIVSWGSAVFRIDNMPISGVISADYEHKRTRKIVRSGVPGAAPLGRPTGLYSVPTFTVRMLKEDAAAFDTYLADQIAYEGFGSIADTPFTFTAQCVENDSHQVLTAIGEKCLVDGKKSVYDEGVDALVDEYTFSCLQISESDAQGKRFLYSTAPNAWDKLAQDYVTIGGQKSPGRASILDMKRKIGWDVRKAYGLDKATLVPVGNDPATFSVRFDFWDPAEKVTWDAFAKTYLKWALVRVPGGATKALKVLHPILQAQPFAVQDCVVSEIHGLNKDEEGLWGCTIDFMEYGAPVIALQKARGTIDGKAVQKPVAQTAQQQYLQKIAAQDAADSAAYAAAIANGAR